MRPLLLATVLLIAESSTFAQEPSPAEVEWLRKQAIPLKSREPGSSFEDLAPLKSMIGDARIVSLGECTHGTREVFQLKHRLVEYLVAEMGFSIFSIEASMPEAYRLNEYVLEGKGDVEQLIDGMYFWTWNTEEVKSMVEWMRAFNKSGKGRIEFTGFDMQTPDVAMKIVTDFLSRADPDRASSVRDTYSQILQASQQSGPDFGVATGSFPIEAARGKKIRYSGWIRTADVTGTPPGLWWRADGPSGVLAFENSQERSPTGSSDWKESIIELAIPAETTNINFGVTFGGRGTVWFDGFRIEIDGVAFDATGKFGLDFEGDAVEGFFTAGQGYAATIDETVARSGKKSLRMKSGVAAPRPQATMDAAEAAQRAEKVVQDMDAARERLAKATTEKDADWAIQNARVVHQCCQMRSGEVERDVSMARNVKWIFEQARPGARMILWAHNGHVSRAGMMGRASMGKSLDEWYGPEQFIIGFSAGSGEYTAMKQGRGLRSDNVLVAPPVGSVEDYFRRTGIPLFLIDLRKAASSDDAAWLAGVRMHLSIGAVAMDRQHYPLDVPGSYDALIFIEQTSATRLLPRAGGAKK